MFDLRGASSRPPGWLSRSPARLLYGLAERVQSAPLRLGLARLARSQRPIVVGPWLSEVGYELLYWIPFLRWAKSAAAIDEQRLVVVSRGGVASWYRGVCGRYVDIFDYYTPQEFRELNASRTAGQKGELKHWSVSPFDREIISRVKHTIGAADVDLLHPSWMYRLFQFSWLKRAGVQQLERFTSPALLACDGGEGKPSWLPDEYVAVKFYFSPSFPDLPENRRFVASVLERLSATTNVVLLSTGLELDDHRDYQAAPGGSLVPLGKHITPRDNLALQTAVVQHARAFVGTYGGFSYLAPFCGVSSLSFYSHPEAFNPHHLHWATNVFSRLGDTRFVTLGVEDVDLLHLVM